MPTDRPSKQLSQNKVSLNPLWAKRFNYPAILRQFNSAGENWKDAAGFTQPMLVHYQHLSFRQVFYEASWPPQSATLASSYSVETFRPLVEAAGIEPASQSISTKASTHIVYLLISPYWMPTDRPSIPLSQIKFRQTPFERKGLTILLFYAKSTPQEKIEKTRPVLRSQC